MGVPRFLIVEPDADTAAILVRVCSEMRPSKVVTSLDEALSTIVARRTWCGVIMELELPDGSGLKLLERVRALHPFLPVLVLTGSTDPATINRVHVLRAEYHCKPTRRRALAGFLRLAVALERTKDERIARVIETDSGRFGLTSRESEILAAAVAGTPRKILAGQLGTTENTLKTQVRSLLRKCGHESLEELGRYVLHQALGASDGPISTEHGREHVEDSSPPTIRPSTGRIRASSAHDLPLESGLVRSVQPSVTSETEEFPAPVRHRDSGSRGQ